jgi:hypothetical protein
VRAIQLVLAAIQSAHYYEYIGQRGANILTIHTVSIVVIILIILLTPQQAIPTQLPTLDLHHVVRRSPYFHLVLDIVAEYGVCHEPIGVAE